MIAGMYSAVQVSNNCWRLVYTPITRHLTELIECGDESYIKTMVRYYNGKLFR